MHQEGGTKLASTIEPYNEASDDMELIISILVNYPQINKVNINSDLKRLTFTFLVDRGLEKTQVGKFKCKLEQSLRMFNKLTDLSTGDNFEVNFESYEELTKIKINAKLFNLTQEKISFFVQFVSEEFKDELLREDFETDSKNKFENQKGTIGNALLNLKQNGFCRPLVGFREEGKVLVFTKSSN